MNFYHSLHSDNFLRNNFQLMPSLTVSKDSTFFKYIFHQTKRFLKASNKHVPGNFVNVVWIMAEIKRVVRFWKETKRSEQRLINQFKRKLLWKDFLVSIISRKILLYLDGVSCWHCMVSKDASKLVSVILPYKRYKSYNELQQVSYRSQYQNTLGSLISIPPAVLIFFQKTCQPNSTVVLKWCLILNSNGNS